MSSASKRANGRVSGPVLLSLFLAVFDHSGMAKGKEMTNLQAFIGLAIFMDGVYNLGHFGPF